MSAPAKCLRFADFELRPDSGELRRAGEPVKLQPQPAKVLELLASRSGEVVSREEIRRAVWGESFVDFDANLNFSIKEIRRALGDSATSPHFVETVPRRGYRFLKPVTSTPEAGGSATPSLRRSWRTLATLVLLLLLTFVIGSRLQHSTARTRLAVLPVACRSQEPVDQQVCGGIAEALGAEITRELSRDVDVIAPHSSLVYGLAKGAHVLGPSATLSGDAQPSPQGLRLNLSLRGADGEELWKNGFDVELRNAPLTYGEITRRVAQALQIPAPLRPAAQPKPRPAAYEAYLRGIYLRRHEKCDQAAAKLQEATLLDPDFASAFAALAQARMKVLPEPDPEATEAAARHSLELDPDLADGHRVLGNILLHRYHDWRGAGRELEKALALAPGDAENHYAYSLYLAALGRLSEAISSAERARELDPASMFIGSDYAWYFYLDHNYEEAIRQARAVLSLFPLSEGVTPQEAHTGKLFCDAIILNSAWLRGQKETALDATRAFLRDYNAPQAAARIRDVNVFWRGREEALRDLLRTRPVDPYELAQSAMTLNEPGRALDLLTQQCSTPGMTWMPFAAVEPLFDPLHEDPRWPQVLACLKLPADAPARRRVG
ncbi:MAG TPA: winged helix-turn-helix domain-containing protein [Thermoanaerobaculia bacterium]|nr:winged helix-turn-helix domain-containing protein [Thermoanaerobaculia bacterium]